MSKKLREATNFLSHIFDQDMLRVAAIYTAEADKDYERIIDELEIVIGYATDLKSTLVNEMFCPSAREE